MGGVDRVGWVQCMGCECVGGVDCVGRVSCGGCIGCECLGCVRGGPSIIGCEDVGPVVDTPFVPQTLGRFDLGISTKNIQQQYIFACYIIFIN